MGAKLVNKIEHSSGLRPEHEQAFAQLKTKKTELEKDRDMLKQNTEMLQGICQETWDKVCRTEDVKASSEEQILDIKQKVADKRSEVEAEKRRKEELEQQMKDLRQTNESQQEEASGIARTIQAEEADLFKVE